MRVLHSGVGAITESDVTLASASGAPIIGFNVRPNAKAREVAERNKVECSLLRRHLPPDRLGEGGDGRRARPRDYRNGRRPSRGQEVFPAGKKDKAAGLLVTEGVIRKGLFARLTREDVIVSATTISSLRRFKDDVAEVRAGLECGVVLADTNDIKPGDMLEVFEVEERARTLVTVPLPLAGGLREGMSDAEQALPLPQAGGEAKSCAAPKPLKAAPSAFFGSASRCGTC